MANDFVKYILEHHKNTESGPLLKDIIFWIDSLKKLLFPETRTESLSNETEISKLLSESKHLLFNIISDLDSIPKEKHIHIVDNFYKALPKIYSDLHLDVESCYQGDPAAVSYIEITRSYPGFYAVFIYRMAHNLYKLDVPLIPRILTEYAHQKTGIDIHPGAKIGQSFFIDHGTGVVIGETCIIGNHVKIYQGVTLGALSIDKSMAGKRRHPQVENNVVIYSGATILGGDTTIGEGSIIGGNVWITRSVPPKSRVYHLADNNQIIKF